MAWTTPRTWASNEIVTAAHLNTNIKDNTQALYDDKAWKVTTATAEGVPVTSWKIQPFTAGKAPFAAAMSSQLYGTIRNPMFALGYNVEAYLQGGSGGVSGEPALQMFVEADYFAANWATSGVDERTMEWYVQYISPDHTSVTNFRPIMTTVGRNGNTDRWASTSINIGTDASEFRSQFFIDGTTRIARFTNSAINLYEPVTTHGGFTVSDNVNNRNLAEFTSAATSQLSTVQFYAVVVLGSSDSTATRPVGTGTRGGMWYDAYLGKPIWRDGFGNWRDAAGTIV